MENIQNLWEYFKGYQHVADFQRFCGVEIQEVEQLEEQEPVHNVNGTNGDTNYEVSKRKPNSQKNGTNGFKNGVHNPNAHEKKLAYRIKNMPFYLLMRFGAGMGGEPFYMIFFPFMAWNVDGRLCRQLLLVWYPLMYVGQLLKDIIKWPRPGPPAVRLEGKRYEQEYGMPSTHTIVGTCVPLSLLILTSRYYEYSFLMGLLCAIIWTGLVVCSRVYLGMHTVLDCIAGLTITLVALPWMLHFVEYVDYYQVTSPYAPFSSLLIPILICVYYPKPKEWSITRGDTSNIVSIASLFMVVYWIFYQIGWLIETPRPTQLQPLPDITSEWLYHSALRTVFGIVGLVLSRIVSKKIFLKFVCYCAGVDTKDIARQRKLGLEVPLRWLTVGGLAVSTSLTVPLCFHYFGINRANFYRELMM
ncbi:sphingosine-1-phosphate phosphatase 2-like [Dreissena polymorpha]|uniref:Phosphatidic acid phosphatase type 2/haloperoxidase domain-containing protein n=1 Tax=Dreissena polymorpha TaxID=45954 RepID=A0A9D4LIB4_DREPO|nr:sphingosine-1-phosphate phosphatase 2-like [Dreissena polymorpha]KAH3859103.1 hypothetical protein DPMN_101750 [Dreissena polymorpha]